MRKRIIALSAIVLLAGMTVTPAAEGFVKKPCERVINIGKNKTLSLQPGKVQIVLDNDAARSVRFAAEELAEHLGKVLNCTVPVKNGTADAAMTPIYLGLGKNNAMLDSKKLSRDAFYLVIKDGAVRIAGLDSASVDSRKALTGGIWMLMHERATLFGVYDFLERFADCRFYFPGRLGTLTPQKAQLDLPETFIIDRPDWEGRRFNGVYNNSLWFEGKDPRAIKHPGRTMHYYRVRFSTRFPLPSLHGTARMRLNERFGQSNPEYFAMSKNGSRSISSRGVWGASICYSSGIREEIYQDYLAMLRGDVSQRPGLEKSIMWRAQRNEWIKRGVVDVMPADAFERCYCEKCKVAMKADGEFATDLVWGYAAEVADRLKKDGVKDAFVTMSAYYPCQDVPQCDLPDNVDVLVCVTGPWDKYNPVKLKKDNDLIKRWSEKVGHKIMLTNYGYSSRTARSGQGIPDPTPRAHVEYYKNVMPYINGVNDFYDNTDRFMYNHLEDYMFGKLAWDNNVDTEQLFAEYYSRLFGKASGVMRKIMERFEDVYLQQIGGRTVNTPIGPVTSVPSAAELWGKIYTPEVIAGIAAEFDAAEKLVSGIELERVKFFRKEFLDPLAAARSKWSDNASLPMALIGFAGDRADCVLQLNPFKCDSKIKTTVAAQFKNGELVVKFDCEEPEFDKVQVTDRQIGDKECWQDNGVEMVLNPSGDRTNLFHILVSSKGIINAVPYKKYGTSGVSDWQKQIKAAAEVKRTGKGFTVEIRIPESELGEINKKDGFPVNFMRYRNVRGKTPECFVWGRLVKNFHDLENFGTLKVGNPILKNSSFSLPITALRNFSRCPETARDHQTYISAPAALHLDTNAGVKWISQNIEGYKPNTRYRLSFMLKTKNIQPQGKYSSVSAKLQEAPGKQIWVPQNGTVTGDTDWVRHAYEFTSGSKLSNRVSLVCWIYNASGEAWFDDVVLEEIK